MSQWLHTARNKLSVEMILSRATLTLSEDPLLTAWQRDSSGKFEPVVYVVIEIQVIAPFHHFFDFRFSQFSFRFFSFLVHTWMDIKLRSLTISEVIIKKSALSLQE